MMTNHPPPMHYRRAFLYTRDLDLVCQAFFKIRDIDTMKTHPLPIKVKHPLSRPRWRVGGLAVCISLGLSVLVNAQDAADRETHASQSDTAQLLELQQRFRQANEAREARVQAWLQANPDR